MPPTVDSFGRYAIARSLPVSHVRSAPGRMQWLARHVASRPLVLDFTAPVGSVLEVCANHERWRSNMRTDTSWSQRQHSGPEKTVVSDWESILAEQHDRIAKPDRRARFAFVMPALSADSGIRDSVLESFADPANRTHEPWVLEARGFLNHPLRASAAEHYIYPGLELVEEIQATGDIFFPLRWLSSLLGGHRSRSAGNTVRRFLEERPDYPDRLGGQDTPSCQRVVPGFRVGNGKIVIRVTKKNAATGVWLCTRFQTPRKGTLSAKTAVRLGQKPGNRLYCSQLGHAAFSLGTLAHFSLFPMVKVHTNWSLQ